MVYAALSSGDILMINAQTGQLLRDYYIGAPMDVGVTIGASVNGQEYVIMPDRDLQPRGRSDVSWNDSRRHRGLDPAERPTIDATATTTTTQHDNNDFSHHYNYFPDTTIDYHDHRTERR